MTERVYFTVYRVQSRVVPRLPKARLQASTVPVEDVRRLCTGISTRRCKGWSYLQSALTSNNRLHQQVIVCLLSDGTMLIAPLQPYASVYKP